MSYKMGQSHPDYCSREKPGELKPPMKWRIQENNKIKKWKKKNPEKPIGYLAKSSCVAVGRRQVR